MAAPMMSLVRLMMRTNVPTLATTKLARPTSTLSKRFSELGQTYACRTLTSTASRRADESQSTYATPTSKAMSKADKDAKKEVIQGYDEFFSEESIKENNLSEEVLKIFDIANASQKEQSKHAIKALMKEWELHERDTSSTPVLVAGLTGKIQRLQGHCISNPKDLHSRRGLVAMVEQRRKALQYLKRKDFPKYNEVLERLKIRGVIGMR
eukprot:m.56413 g.56413  ORF g.56413 m.56413 type:complete len:210 (-) comp22244_c0_seq1:424-1053(-)